MPLFARAVFGVVNWLAGRRGFQPEETSEEAEEARQRRRTGLRGETFAYWFLRRQGYRMVARNWRAAHRRGEIDLIGWDGDVLAFIEVKTRTTTTGGPPEQAVDAEKQRVLAEMAREYLRRRARRSPRGQTSESAAADEEVRYRFDVLSIEAKAAAPPIVRLHKGAFGAS